MTTIPTKNSPSRKTRDIDPDSPAYAKLFITSWMKGLKAGRRKQFITKYVAYIEGKAVKPKYYEYGLTEKQWKLIWRKLSAYSHKMRRSKPSYGILSS